MGTVYCGPYAEAIGYRDHEGYAARILPDGTETGTWTYATREFTGYRAHCECGWRGTAKYLPTDHCEDLANEEWKQDHLRPMLAAEASKHTVPAAELLTFLQGLRESLNHAVNENGDTVLTERSSGILAAAEHLEHLLDDLGRR